MGGSGTVHGRLLCIEHERVQLIKVALGLGTPHLVVGRDRLELTALLLDDR